MELKAQDLLAIDIANKDVIFSVGYDNIPDFNLDIPILNDSKKLIDIHFKDEAFKLKHLLGAGIYVIAEIGNNHQGSIELGKKLIDEAFECGVNAIKFQHRILENLYSNDDNDSLDLGTQYTKDVLKKYNLSKDDLFVLMDYVKSKGVDVICTPFDSAALKNLLEYNRLDALKIASADCTNLPFLQETLCTGVPVIISTGMTTGSELKEVSTVLKVIIKI